ncbi:hypothetical protein ACIF70_32275 [Actinacidiphila glaucinigra]|uniref:hypothetical protein n=1 Tax=Actinacidiphila glaucinigra TaxID=235986 RepID=UPI0037C56999
MTSTLAPTRDTATPVALAPGIETGAEPSLAGLCRAPPWWPRCWEKGCATRGSDCGCGAFNNIHFHHLPVLARPAGAPDRSAPPIAGDDAAAKNAVTALLDTLGYDTVGVGPLAEGPALPARHPRLRDALPQGPARPALGGPGEPGRPRRTAPGPRRRVVRPRATTVDTAHPAGGSRGICVVLARAGRLL